MDDSHYPPRQVAGFHTKAELATLVQRRLTRLPLRDTVIDAGIVERNYQQRAIRAIGAAFESQQRDALVVMATGAGRTRTVIALVDQLMRANRAKRVLFLADRVALVNQAANAFKAHLPAAATVNLVTEKATDGRVYVCTYPTMTGLINDVSGAGRRFGPGYFDLVVIDEAHRSVYQQYRAIFSYFDSLLVGLTATPKDEVDRNTYSLFHLEDGVPARRSRRGGVPRAAKGGFGPAEVPVRGHPLRRPVRGRQGPLGLPGVVRGRVVCDEAGEFGADQRGAGEMDGVQAAQHGLTDVRSPAPLRTTQCPVLPSMRSRSRSAWPLCLAYSALR